MFLQTCITLIFCFVESKYLNDALKSDFSKNKNCSKSLTKAQYELEKRGT